MSMPYRRRTLKRARYRLANTKRFTAFVLVFLLMLTAVYVIKNHADAQSGDPVSVVITPVATATVTPAPVVPSATPYPVPEGKEMTPVIVALDAGHGGPDPGTISPYKDKFYEKEVTLDVTQKVAELLKQKGIEYRMSRNEDVHLNDNISKDLLMRADVGNSNNAALFVSIHVNYYDIYEKGGAGVNGMEVYYYPKNNLFEGFNDERLAAIMGEKVKASNGINYRGEIERGFSVLRNTLMPAVLVETAYISNKSDEALLGTQDFRQKTAQGIANAIQAALEEMGMFEYENANYVMKNIGE